METGLMVHPSAMAALTAIITASRFKTGRAPGNPKQTGQVLVFGGAPNCVEQEQKILDWVSSCACTSRPITVSYSIADQCQTYLNHPARAVEVSLALISYGIRNSYWSGSACTATDPIQNLLFLLYTIWCAAKY